ncbi:hypothetical protein D3C85_1477350 [compost metagenome]
MQTGAQAAQTFYGQVGGVTACQYGGDLVGAASAVPEDFAFFTFLQCAERNRCVHRQPQLFNLVRIFHAAVKGFSKKHQCSSQESPEQGGNEYDQDFFGFNGLAQIHIGCIDQARVTHGAGTHYIQFLGFIQELGINFGADFYVAGEAKEFLLC